MQYTTQVCQSVSVDNKTSTVPKYSSRQERAEKHTILISGEAALTSTMPYSIIAGDKASVQAAHKEIVEKLGHPEVLVYNAGPGGFQWPPPSILDIPADKFAKGFDNGVTGALLWIQQVCYL